MLRTRKGTLDYVLAHLEKGEEAIREGLHRMEAALVCYDTAQIFTFHGFCFRLLKEFALEANVGANLSS